MDKTALLTRYHAVQEAIEQAAQQAGRDAQSIRLLAVSKGHDAAAIRALLEADHRHFAENRVQEAQEKFTLLKEEYPDLELHLIGPLQTNKTREAVALFDVIHTIDRPNLAEKLQTEIARQSRALSCLIQVNIGEEPQKAGVSPQQTDELIRYCKEDTALPIKGLMCIPPHGALPTPYFALLNSIAKRHGLPELSMGMSEDYETAIRCGATMVRVGTAIFGARET